MTEDYDVIIRNSRIVDGTGKASFKGSVGIKGEKIAAVGNVKGDAAREINGSGLVTCPGFIDPHSHADMTLPHYPFAENFVMQGITTFFGGLCAMSPAPLKNLCSASYTRASEWWHEVEPEKPGHGSADLTFFVPLDKYGEIIKEKLGFAIDWRTFDEFLSRIEKIGISINYAPFVGHDAVRIAVMEEDFKRTATKREIEKMKPYVEEAMLSGAFGFSTFRDPSPGEYASVEEILELVKVASRYGGIYSPHTKFVQSQWPSDDLEEYGYGIYHGPIEDLWIGKYRGLLEAIEISRKAKIRLHIAHLPDVYLRYEAAPHPEFLEVATAKATLWHIDKAREEGVDVSFNILGGSFLGKLPLINGFWQSRNIALAWMNQLSKEEVVEKLKTREFRDKIRRVHEAGRLKFGTIHTRAAPYWMDWFKILSCKNRKYEGKYIGEIAKEKNIDPLEAIFDILVEDPDTIWMQVGPQKLAPILGKGEETGRAVYFRHPQCMPCTDMTFVPFKLTRGREQAYGRSPSPAAYGMYADYVRRVVREQAILSLEEAIKKATYLPAQVLGLNRGIISPEAYADILVFDFEKIRMKGTLIEPAQPPEGIEYVLVNGEIVYEKMEHTGARPGKVLRHK